jgi:uncharacterized protein YndB with AHSA1/START domain
MANIRHNLMIRASAKKVYDAIASEQGLKSWWTNEVTAKPEEGFINHFKFSDEYFNKMKILKLNSPIEIHWECVDGDKEWVGTNLSFELNEKEEGTTLKFSHLNWTNESEFFGFCSYHWGRYMESLKLFCETGKGQPYSK